MKDDRNTLESLLVAWHAGSGNDVLPHCGAALSIVPQGNVSPPQTSDSQQEIAVQPCDRETQVQPIMDTLCKKILEVLLVWHQYMKLQKF